MDFSARERLFARQKLHVIGHAIAAAKITTIGDRQAQVVDLPAKAIDKAGTRSGAAASEAVRSASHDSRLA